MLKHNFFNKKLKNNSSKCDNNNLINSKLSPVEIENQKLLNSNGVEINLNNDNINQINDDDDVIDSKSKKERYLTHTNCENKSDETPILFQSIRYKLRTNNFISYFNFNFYYSLLFLLNQK